LRRRRYLKEKAGKWHRNVRVLHVLSMAIFALNAAVVSSVGRVILTRDEFEISAFI
jgi:hypothetical protein